MIADSPATGTGTDEFSARTSGPSGPPPRVLVIEDDEAVRTVLGRTLAHAGFEPVLAASAQEAEHLISESIAAMVLDFRIPGSRGDLFFYYASSRFPLLRRRTVFLTGDTSVEVEQMVAHTGCTLRHKPFVNASLIGLLKSLVEPTPTPSYRES
jgi:DNA-binding NtrC family response regulator